MSLLSPVWVAELRLWNKVHRPGLWMFSQGHDQNLICKGTAQDIFYRSLRPLALQNPKPVYPLLYRLLDFTAAPFNHARNRAKTHLPNLHARFRPIYSALMLAAGLSRYGARIAVKVPMFSELPKLTPFTVPTMPV